MDNQVQNDDDFAAGFLVKEKNGRFKKVRDDKIIDLDQPAKSVPAPIKPTSVPAAAAPSPHAAPKPWPTTPPPPVSSSARAPLILEPEDEEDIKKHQEELDKILSATVKAEINQPSGNLADKIKSALGLRFADEVSGKRFGKIIESRLKDIRSSIEMEEILTRAKKIGGLELSPELAKKAVSAVEEEMSKLLGDKPLAELEAVKAGEALPVKKEVFPVYAPPPPSFVPRPGATAELYKPVVREKPKPAPQPKPIIPLKQTPPAPPLRPAAAPPSVTAEVKELYRQTPATEMAGIARVRQPEPQRPQMVDIKLPAKVMGPIEELGDIDSKEFRRLGANPTEAAEKILEKIYLLEEESWQMRMDGLKAWQSSPVCKLYVAIGRESLESNMMIDRVIQKMIEEAKPCLMKEEWLAINDLNNKLIA